MFAIASITTVSIDCMNTPQLIRSGAYGILAGTILATIITGIGGGELFSNVLEGHIFIGFNGGLEHKNFLAAAMVGAISGFLVSRQLGNKSKFSIMPCIFAVILLVLSSSRGGYILFCSLIAFANIYKIGRVKKQSRIAFYFLSFLGIVVFGVNIYKLIAISSSTYMYRIRGFTNYVRYYSGDIFHLLLGNAEMAFRDTSESFSYRIRSVVGFDGSAELSYLNILVKNGILGLLGYFLIFYRYVKNINSINQRSVKFMYLSILFTMGLSTLVEAYIVNVHLVYGMYPYMLMSGLIGIYKMEVGFCDDNELQRAKRMASV